VGGWYVDVDVDGSGHICVDVDMSVLVVVGMSADIGVDMCVVIWRGDVCVC